jgi:hypothetical protein
MEMPEGHSVVLEPTQLQTLLRKSFNLGMDLDARKPKALNRLELSKALVGAAETHAIAAKAIALERGDISPEEIVGTESWALQAAAFNGMPDPVFHLAERAMCLIAALAQIEPDPRAAPDDLLLNTAMRAATGVAQLLQARHGFTTASTDSEREAVTCSLRDAEQALREAADHIVDFFKLADASWRAGRRGETDLN